jgi:hypothetical protein
MATWSERRRDESPKAFAAFTIYRDLGESRSLDAAWRAHRKRKRGSAPGHWNKWSSRYAWPDRAARYDEHLNDLVRQAREKRFLELAARRAEYEFRHQDRVEELADWFRAAIEKHNAIPATDIERKEDKEVTVGTNGELKVVTVTTKIKGMKASGLARLGDAYRETLDEAVLGPPRDKKDRTSVLAPKAIMPEFMRVVLEDRARQITDGKDKANGSDDSPEHPNPR